MLRRSHQPSPVRVGAVFFLFHFPHALHGAAAGFGRGAKHGIVTAFRADMFHFGVLSFAFAGGDNFHGATATGTRHLFTDGHHFDVRRVGGHFLNHDVFALAAGHGHGVAGLQCFRLRLSGDVLHLHHLVLAALHRRHLVLCICRSGKQSRERQGDRESRTEADFLEEVVFHFHNCVFRLLIFCLLLRTSCSQIHCAACCAGVYLLSIIWCSPPFIGFIPSLLLLVVEQPLANAKATAIPMQRLILVRSLCLVFISDSFWHLLVFAA